MGWAGNSMYFNGGVHTLSYQRSPSHRSAACMYYVNGWMHRITLLAYVRQSYATQRRRYDVVTSRTRSYLYRVRILHEPTGLSKRLAIMTDNNFHRHSSTVSAAAAGCNNVRDSVCLDHGKECFRLYNLCSPRLTKNWQTGWTRGSAMAEGPRDALVSRNSATTTHPIWKLECLAYRVALFSRFHTIPECDRQTDTQRQHIPRLA